MLYFAYGSNLDPDQMRERCPHHVLVGLAALHDHKVAFPLFSNRWGSGVAGVVRVHGEKVWGVLYDLDDADLAALDAHEDWKGPRNQHNLYERESVTVELVRPDDGSVPRRVRAYTYLPRMANPSPPSRRYLDTVLRGARHHRLPEEYIERLASVETVDEQQN